MAYMFLHGAIGSYRKPVECSGKVQAAWGLAPPSPLSLPAPLFSSPPPTVLSRVHLLRNLNQVAFLPGVESVARLHPNIYSSDLLWCKVFWGSLLEPCGVSVEYSLSSSLTSGTERCSSLPRATQLHGRILS